MSLKCFSSTFLSGKLKPWLKNTCRTNLQIFVHWSIYCNGETIFESSNNDSNQCVHVLKIQIFPDYIVVYLISRSYGTYKYILCEHLTDGTVMWSWLTLCLSRTTSCERVMTPRRRPQVSPGAGLTLSCTHTQMRLLMTFIKLPCSTSTDSNHKVHRVYSTACQFQDTHINLRCF